MNVFSRFKKSAVREAPSTGTDDPYSTHREIWDEWFGTHARRERQWRYVAFIAIAAVLITASMNVYLSGRARIVPHIVEVNKAGTILGSYSPANFRELVSENVYRAAIKDWIEALRTVTPDVALQSKLIQRVQSHLRSGDPVVATVSELYSSPTPYERAEKELVSVRVDDFRQLTPQSWYVSWNETISIRGGSSTRQQTFTATITAQQDNVSESNVLINPLGIYITLFDMGN